VKENQSVYAKPYLKNTNTFSYLQTSSYHPKSTNKAIYQGEMPGLPATVLKKQITKPPWILSNKKFQLGAIQSMVYWLYNFQKETSIYPSP